MIPRVIHFVFGLDEDFGGIPFSLFHLIAAKSARQVHPDFDVVVHYRFEPTDNRWWGDLRQIAAMDRLKSVPTQFGDAPILQTAHKADAVRMCIMATDGGIYLDMDTLCISRFDPLLTHACVMGFEVHRGETTGLCNAVIMAEPGAEFIRIWSRRHHDFDPRGWDEFSVKTPLRIYEQHPDLVHVEPSESFFPLSWDDRDLELVYEQVTALERSYSIHLWESVAYARFLSRLSEEDILSRDSTYNILARRALKGVPPFRCSGRTSEGALPPRPAS